jgi:hypothetical protein
MSTTLVIAKTRTPAGEGEDVFDLDVDTSVGLDGCRALAARLVGNIRWAGDMGTATTDGHDVVIEATDIGLVWIRFPDLEQDSSAVQRVVALASELGLAVIDEDSAEMLRGGLGQ